MPKKSSHRNQRGGRVTPKGTRPADRPARHDNPDHDDSRSGFDRAEPAGPRKRPGQVDRPQPFLRGQRGNR